ncbi:MAG: Tfx family DNA-binding protein [Euryarchaeota archaeon]|nr:Tfx family DNA-binding protein [Euryarchaeota archaeon]
MVRDTVLTERQIEVLRLRAQGLSTSEIAERLGTTVANVSATERKARENIRRAENTLRLVRMLEAPLRVLIPPGTDLNDAVREIYRRADRAGIWVAHSFPSLAALIQRGAGERIRGRRVLAEIEVVVTREGEVMVVSGELY